MKRRLVFALSVLLLASASTLGLAADPEGPWTQIDNDDGIRTWKMERPGQDLPGFRGQTVMDASAADIRTVIEQVSKHPQWMQNCVDAKMIERMSPDHAIVYNRTGAPWPVWDRDVVLDTIFTPSADGKLLTLTFHDTDPKRFPLPHKTVRMPHLSGFYKLETLAPNRTRVTYQVMADVGGSIPRWLADRIAKEMPYKTLSRLRARVTGKH
ncbi:MAG: START domain-containing protein [Myxococcales bacterium]